MSEFRGFRCNDCGAIVSVEDRVKERVVFIEPDGTETSFFRDLCVQTCAPARREEVERTHERTPTRARRKEREVEMAGA